MDLLREYIRKLLKEQNVLAVGMCFPFAAKKAEEWFDQHFVARKGRAPKRHPDLNDMSKFKVVHGKVTDQWKKPPKPIVHAWVEMGDLVFDDQTRMTKPDGVPKDVYYDMYQPEVVKEYNAEEVVVNCIMKGEGPWDKGLIDTMKQRDAWMNESTSNVQIPQRLYHATYGPLVNSIQRHGLGGDRDTVWEDSVRGTVYLALDPEIAFSYAETSDDAWDKFETEDGLEIITFEIDTAQLDPAKFNIDQNVIGNEGDTLEYYGVVPPSALKIARRDYA